MAIQADITKDMLWFKGELKAFPFTVTEEDGSTPVDLSGVTTLVWKVLRERGSPTVYMELTKAANEIQVGGGSNNIATATVQLAHYEDLPAGDVDAYHELWDRDNDVLLSFGQAYINDAGEE